MLTGSVTLFSASELQLLTCVKEISVHQWANLLSKLHVVENSREI